MKVSFTKYDVNLLYRQTSNVKHTDNENLENISRLVFQLYLPNQLKPSVK